MKRKLMAIVMAGIMASSIMGCSSASNEEESAGSQTTGTQATNSNASDVSDNGETANETMLVIGTSTDFQGLQVLTAIGGAGGMQWTAAVYTCLATRLVNAGDAIPVMYEAVEEIDNLRYEIKLYDDIYDSDGNHITASDVAFCYNYAKENGVDQTYNYVEVTATDEYTVELEMATDAIGVLEDVLSSIVIVDQSAFEADGSNFATRTCGCGPYKITDYVDGAYYTLEKVENWWGNNHSVAENMTPNIDKITYQYIAESSQLAVALESGTIDLAIGLSGSEIDRFLTEEGTAKEGFSASHYLNSLYQAMILNMDYNSIFYNNKELREAINYAIDKDSLVIAALSNKGEKCYTLGSENFGDFQEQWKEEDYFNYDLAKAQELLDASNFDTSQTIRIMLDTNEVRIKEAQMIAAYLGQIGIKTEILSYDTALFDEYKLDSTQWDIMLDNFYSPDYLVSGWSHCFYYENYLNGSVNHLHDDILIEMIVEGCTPEGHTPEKVDEIHQYIKDTASAVGLIDSYNYVIGREGIDIYISTYRSTAFGWACVLADDFVSVGQ